ncbi:MAG: ATP-binding protein [Candidatus Omnitrophica bacterium]|nr:ATP-binding protein [Candidatus Omnitrophota bacterium]MBU4479769.1 ATP-binding protein [Candidatus Omnitrophota bacterium]MCG2703292.1 ATP-binding protein [Candidatus Omnitrophota bacterium]
MKNAGRQQHKSTLDFAAGQDRVFHSLFAAMPQACALHRLCFNRLHKPVDYTFLDVNPAYEAFTGIKRSKLLSLAASELYGKKIPPYLDVFFRVAVTRKPEYFETVFGERYCLVNAFSLDDNCIVTVFFDITERKEAQEQMQNMAKFPSQNPYPVMRIDCNGILLYANTASFSFLTEWNCRVGEPVPEPWKKLVRESLESGLRTHVECEHRERAFSFTVTPLTETGYVNLYGMDITERKNAEKVLQGDKEAFERLVEERTQELIKTQIELEQAKRLSDIGTLAAVVAHELRNPLVTMQMAVFNIKKKQQNPLIDKHLLSIEKKIVESDQIINNLLFYSRLKIPRLERIKLYDTLKESIAMARKNNGKKKVTFSRRFSGIRGLFISADPLQMKELFDNILNNACDAVSDKSGRIEITAGYEGDEQLNICVRDNGEGISEEVLKKIFEPFFTTKSKGTGLGLAVCRQIVALHAGTLDISSEKGKGTTVKIVLPLRGKNES